MKTAAPAHVGWLQSLRSLGDDVLGGVQERLELFTVELQEEKFRLIQTFVRISAAVFAAMLAITFASLALVYLCWETARFTVLVGLAVFYTSALVVILVTLRRYLDRQPKPFAATLHELNEDRACIRGAS